MSYTESSRAAQARRITPEEAASKTYDLVIVGSGISGSILADEITKKGYDVLIVEAGAGGDLSQEEYLYNFYSSIYKDNNAPFPFNQNAEMPRGTVLRKLKDGEINPDAYWVQKGPGYISDSVYTRAFGGTTVHWEGKTIRMLRDDFKSKSKYLGEYPGLGLDWPIGLDELIPYYERAEFVLGVAGDVDSQKSVGVEFSPGYVYPMVELKASYLDLKVAKGLAGMKEKIDDEEFNVEWITFPQAKNADPNPQYGQNGSLKFIKPGELPYQPVGAVSSHQSDEGMRCQGNTNCVPLCPVQARFDARKILVKALATGTADLLTQAVASRVLIDPITKAVTEIEVKCYGNTKSSTYKAIKVRGKIFSLAANAVENARLMLASAKLDNWHVNDLMGRHLMDHPYLLCWGWLPEKLVENAGVGRGPSCTSGLCNFRTGKFRKKFAPFAADIHNDGWGWATGSPGSDLIDAVDNGRFFGRVLRNELNRRISRQLLLAYMIEMPADPKSRVTVDENYTDALGNMRPVIDFKLSDYSMRTAEYVRGLSRRMFAELGDEKLDRTHYDPGDYSYVQFNGSEYSIRGGNHLSGTHVMGTTPINSVVDADQRSWDHRNLYMVGPGSMPSIGSSNTTLTVVALCFKTSEAILKDLEKYYELEQSQK